MGNRGNYDPRRDGYYDGGIEDTRVYRNGIPDMDGYYDDGGQDDGQNYGDYDAGEYDDYGDYGDGDYGNYGDEDYGDYDGGYRSRNSGMSMAARAAGKQNTDPYRQRRQNSRQRQARRTDSAEYDYNTYDRRTRKRPRKRRHRFRNFLIFLLLLAAALGICYVLLFRAPEQSQDFVHTRKADFYNILLCATDEEENRTDTIMLATLDERQGSISLTSLPRDTIVDNGEWVPKLNGVYGLAGGGAEGAEALMDQVETLLGFRPDGYVVINYQVFKDAVDAMGGVTFDVPMDMEVDNANDPNDILQIPAGEQLLNGTQALAVCRFRYGYLMADIQRQYVQQTFLKAMIKQCLSPSKWLRLPAVYGAVMDNMITDLDGANIRYLALHVLLAGIDEIQQNTLPGEGVDYNGASCYGLYGQSVVDMVNQVMNPYEEEITLDDVHILTVSEGELVESTWSGVAFDASSYQYD